MLFTELPFLERFAAAREAGFEAVEFLFPYEWPAAELGRRLREHGLSQALFNMPPGNWGAGERGMAAIPGREAEFRAHLPSVRDYALALGCTKVHAMSGIVDPIHSLAAHRQTLIENIRFAADFLAADGIKVLLEPLNDRDVPGYFLAHQLDALALVQEIDRPNVGGAARPLPRPDHGRGSHPSHRQAGTGHRPRPDSLGTRIATSRTRGRSPTPTCSRCWRRRATTTG